MPPPEPNTELDAVLLKPTRERIRRDLERVSDDVRPLVELIDGRLFDPDLDVNLLLRTCKPGRATLRRFREQLGLTPWAYITDLRMEAAELLLRATGMKVWQVAAAVGSKRGFSARFKKCRGRSPEEAQRDFQAPEAQRLEAHPQPAPAEATPEPAVTLTVIEPAPAGVSPSWKVHTVYHYRPQPSPERREDD